VSLRGQWLGVEDKAYGLHKVQDHNMQKGEEGGEEGLARESSRYTDQT
jgi:hypothetical protein